MQFDATGRLTTQVLIVGGGLTGLALADQLHQAGIRFELVEANDRLGGRIYSVSSQGAYYDLGPTWIWPGQPLVAEMLARFKLTTFEQFSTGSLAFQDANGQVHKDQGYASMEGSYRISGGVGALVRELTASLPPHQLHLNSQVNGVTRGSQELIASLSTDGETRIISAQTIVLAMPPRIAESSITLDPPLDSNTIKTLRAIPTWMAGHAKLLAVYDQPYWRERGYSGDAMSQRGPLLEVHDASPHEGGPYALFGFVGLPANARRSLQQSQLLAHSRLQLDQLFGGEMGEPLALKLHDWAQEPLVATELDQQGLSHHPTYGRPSELNSLWNGRLMLASAELDARFGGLLEGALQVARYTANRLLEKS